MSKKNTLTIQLSASNNIVSRITRWTTRGEFTHVDIILPNTPDVLIGAHVFGGIQKKTFIKNDFVNIKRYELEVSIKVINWVNNQLGKKYDLMAIAGFVFKIPANENTASICSEFVFDAIEQSNCFNHKVKFQSSKISPRDLHLVLQTLEAVGCAKLV
jgi:hypothetical protein